MLARANAGGPETLKRPKANKIIAQPGDGQTVKLWFSGSTIMAKRGVECFLAAESNSSMNNESEKPVRDVMAVEKETQGVHNDRFVENSINLSLLDPPKYGWSALGSVNEMLPPHQSARRRSLNRSLPTQQKHSFGSKRARLEGALETTALSMESAGSVVSNEPIEGVPKIRFGDLRGKSQTSGKTDNTAPLQRFQALERGMLNVKAYHRGIEGNEPRDEETGELLYVTRPTETGLTSSGPNSLQATVTIQFPLNDLSSTDLDGNTFFRQTICWDLGNPRSPTPLLFAGKIATEFGLTYTETLDLAYSIQKQLQCFCSDNFANALPTLIKQGNSPKPQPTMCHLYGDITGSDSVGGLGTLQPKRPVLSTSQRSNSSVNSKSGQKAKFDRDSGIKRKAPPTTALPSGTERSSDSTEKIFYRQILSRLKRATDEYLRSQWNSSNEMHVRDVGRGRCHLCQEDYENVLQYPCGIQGHTICEKHMLQKHGMSSQSVTKPLTECPVCSLRCGCSFCNCKHSILASRLKKMCLQQGAKPQTTHIQGIHAQCVAISLVDCKEYLRANSASRNFLLRPQVPKISPDDFPREVNDGFEVDIEYQEHYEMIFTSSGGQKHRKNDNPPKFKAPPNIDDLPSTPETTEADSPAVMDGNTDFCMVCNKVGSLICCDVCPRAFHCGCVPDGCAMPVDGKQWVCPSCQSEIEGLSSDKIDGSKHFEMIKSIFSRRQPLSRDADLMKVLSIVLEMIEVLIDYDFGYMFCTPVNPKQVCGYDKVVKSPMDLGTIKNGLLSGHYAKALGGDYTIEESVLAVLQDIELVWHNCLLFNVEGSAVYRMSGVLSRRAATIRQKSFDEMIPIGIKEKLASYTNGLEFERGEAKQVEKRPPTSIPTNRHKVANCAKGAHQRRRPIVGLDPDTGMVIKLYSTMLSFSNAVNILVSKGVKCEYKGQEIENTNKLRTFVTRSSGDPSIRLFGYRWLFLDELYEKKVRFQDDMFSKNNKEEDEVVKSTTETMRWGIAVQTSEGVTCFRNLEEAISLIICTTDHNVGNLRRSLTEAGTATCDGFTITRLTDSKPRPEPLILKQDTIAGGRILMGFSNIDCAFSDWKDAIESATFDYSGSITKEAFRDSYLGKERSVDGVRYFMVPREESTVKPSAENPCVAPPSFPKSEVAREGAAEEKSNAYVEATTKNRSSSSAITTRQDEELVKDQEKFSMLERETTLVKTENSEIAVDKGSKREEEHPKPSSEDGPSQCANENMALNGLKMLSKDHCDRQRDS